MSWLSALGAGGGGAGAAGAGAGVGGAASLGGTAAGSAGIGGAAGAASSLGTLGTAAALAKGLGNAQSGGSFLQDFGQGFSTEVGLNELLGNKKTEPAPAENLVSTGALAGRFLGRIAKQRLKDRHVYQNLALLRQLPNIKLNF